MDLGFHLALSYRDLKHPTSRKNFADVVGQNHALILTQCHKSLFWVPILAAGGLYWVRIPQKVGSLLGPYFKA